jgi:beta-phosphoglucomutase family hydrolase
VFKPTPLPVITHDGEDVGESEDPVLGLPEQITACLFDLDGVLTDTASVHKKAWKTMFDDFLSHRDGERSFTDADYREYVDGKTRDDGVRSFLASRGIELPDGAPDDKGHAATVHGLANRKNDLFQDRLHQDGVTVFDGSRRYLQAVADAGLAIAVVSSSANTQEVLDVADLTKFVDCRVDGNTIRTEHLAGKPAPDSYLRAAQLLGVAPDAAAVFEDAISGVQAGRAGGFGVVVGVDRHRDPEALRRNGADVVVADLSELLVAR